ncbi:MAG: ABC transporter ATP-binding protein [Bacteroidales bacterium]|jgi:lipoprotein-releasing system ATP-binding protein|nr:ABC transporter ATP-binding protein [Bacteroidales bacterium]
MIRGENITKSFGNLQVLKGIDIQIPEGKIVSIVGASGAGKTTLLQILGTLSRPTSGKVFIGDNEVSQLNEKEISRFRNQNIGFVFQFHHLLPEFTALENVCIPAYINNISKAKAEEKARELLSFLGLSERLSHKPDELSGGEQQRVSVARALINDPKVIFADEPSGNLDSQNKQELHSLFFTLRDTFRQTFVIVTHDTHLAEMSDMQYEMNDGKIIGHS